MPSKRLISFQHPLYRENFLSCFITKNNSSFSIFSSLYDSVKYIWFALCGPLSSGQIPAGYFGERDSNYLLASFVFCALFFSLPDPLDLWFQKVTVHDGGDAPQQVTSMVAGRTNWELISWTTSMKLRGHTGCTEGFLLSNPSLNSILPLGRVCHVLWFGPKNLTGMTKEQGKNRYAYCLS